MNWIKKHKVYTIILAFVLLMVIGIAGSNNSPATKTSDKASSTPTSQNITKTTPTPIKITEEFVFDVPSLVGKNVDEVRLILGPPADKDMEPTAQQVQLGGTEWYNTFKKNDKELLVTFNSKSRKITDFFISTDDASGKTKDKTHLLGIGNLTENNPKYKIEFVKVLVDPSSFTGVKVIPNL